MRRRPGNYDNLITHINSYLDDIVYDDDFLVLTEYGQVGFGQIHAVRGDGAFDRRGGVFRFIGRGGVARDNPWLSRDTGSCWKPLTKHVGAGGRAVSEWGSAVHHPQHLGLLQQRENRGRIVVWIRPIFSAKSTTQRHELQHAVTLIIQAMYIARKGMVTGAPNVNGEKRRRRDFLL